ncbi:hypothetical protein B7435_16995 [Mycolicibacterium peregrinum]|uniref:hypothetical protein n=1 Tax=Mycolicibacterium peregrinum TaxID=43304 RepID=UPI000B4B43AC|nr:hypothetical protein [Mycolicibacterium peregrinum]OWM01258.1 hypothetical protein B7435_16995 [Mycolicibacterium peregrinum]
MGYDAHSVDVNFTIAAANTDAALAAVNALTGCTYASLSDAIHEETFFEDCTEDAEYGFSFGFYSARWTLFTEKILTAVAPFAHPGSYARFQSGDDSLFGFLVADGCLQDEVGHFEWTTSRQSPPITRL